GRDAADKLAVLAGALFGLTVETASLHVRGIDTVTVADLAAARALGGALKPAVVAQCDGRGLAAFAGPCWVPASHPLASVHGRDNTIVIEGPHIGRVTFSGAGAGPDITAATLIDDAIEASAEGTGTVRREWRGVRRVTVPNTGWFAHIRGAGAAQAALIALQLDQAGLAPRAIVATEGGLGALLESGSEGVVFAVLTALRAQGMRAAAWRALHD
ncbi:MAG: hypothetical protein M3R55_01930, partial [Acidobacteriota bacterium]|nr:hypothetical protein [Acidobacteriota bacterium]